MAWANRDNSALAIGLIVTLPRSLTTVMHLQIVQSYWAQWKNLKERLSIAEASLTPRCPNQDLTRVWRQNLAWLNEAELSYSITITLGDDLNQAARSALDQELTLVRPEFLYIRQPKNLPAEVIEWAKDLPKYIGVEAIIDELN